MYLLHAWQSHFLKIWNFHFWDLYRFIKSHDTIVLLNYWLLIGRNIDDIFIFTRCGKSYCQRNAETDWKYEVRIWKIKYCWIFRLKVRPQILWTVGLKLFFLIIQITWKKNNCAVYEDPFHLISLFFGFCFNCFIIHYILNSEISSSYSID